MCLSFSTLHLWCSSVLWKGSSYLHSYLSAGIESGSNDIFSFSLEAGEGILGGINFILVGGQECFSVHGSVTWLQFSRQMKDVARAEGYNICDGHW